MKKIKDELIVSLKKAMEVKGLSSSTVARIIGCNQSQVGRWIKGLAKPTPVYRDLIRKGLNRIHKLP